MLSKSPLQGPTRGLSHLALANDLSLSRIPWPQPQCHRQVTRRCPQTVLKVDGPGPSSAIDVHAEFGGAHGVPLLSTSIQARPSRWLPLWLSACAVTKLGFTSRGRSSYSWKRPPRAQTEWDRKKREAPVGHPGRLGLSPFARSSRRYRVRTCLTAQRHGRVRRQLQRAPSLSQPGAATAAWADCAPCTYRRSSDPSDGRAGADQRVFAAGCLTQHRPQAHLAATARRTPSEAGRLRGDRLLSFSGEGIGPPCCLSCRADTEPTRSAS